MSLTGGDMGQSILIVDDKLALRTLMSKVLSKEGYKTYEASNGKEALFQVSQIEDLALIFLDIMMPELDGHGFLEQVQEMKQEKKFKICMLTAKSMFTSIKDSLRLGADDYLIKPLDNKLLLEKAENYLTGMNRGNFAEVEISEKAEIMMMSDTIEITLKTISESAVGFESFLDLPMNAKVLIRSKYLEDTIGINSDLFFHIYGQKEDSGLYMASFIGLQDKQAQKIRSVCMKGGGKNE